MTTTEDRLRDALSATAALVTDAAEAPPVRIRPGRVQRFGPLAAAAAVLLVVLATTVYGWSRGGTPAVGPRTAPRYFLANAEGGSGPQGLSVRDIQTGRVTAQVKPPAGVGECLQVSASTLPGVFYAVFSATPRIVLYQVLIDDSGRVRSLIKKFTANAHIIPLMSPDGTRMAFPVPDSGATRQAAIEIRDLVDPRPAVYRASVTSDVTDLSWSADGRYLAFGFISRDSGGFRVLDTRQAKGTLDLLAGSRPVLFGQQSVFTTNTRPLLSADGRSLFLTTAGRASTQIVELDAQTGRPLGVVYQQPHPKGDHSPWAFTQIARDPAGTALLVVDHQGHAHRIDLATGHVSAVPFTGGAPNTIAW